MIVPMPPSRPVKIPPRIARILLGVAVPMLAVAVALALFRDRATAAGPAPWLVIAMLALVVAWLAVAAFGGHANE